MAYGIVLCAIDWIWFGFNENPRRLEVLACRAKYVVFWVRLCTGGEMG